jgi:predicted amidophosphoribosyltransferase
VVLVDDVLTTGATALACVECLTDAGGQVAGVLTIAQTD